MRSSGRGRPVDPSGAHAPREVPTLSSLRVRGLPGVLPAPRLVDREEAARAINAGYGHRMMLELAPDRSFGVLSPAFGGCEAFFAVQEYAARGCTFYKDERCELHGTGVQPLECRVCHHAQPGLGPACHADIEQDWNTPAGRALVAGWCRLTGVWEFLDAYGLRQLMA